MAKIRIEELWITQTHQRQGLGTMPEMQTKKRAIRSEQQEGLNSKEPHLHNGIDM